MVLSQSKRTLTFPPLTLGDMFWKSESLIQSGTHILSYCADSLAIKLCSPIGLYRLRLIGELSEYRPGSCGRRNPIPVGAAPQAQPCGRTPMLRHATVTMSG